MGLDGPKESSIEWGPDHSVGKGKFEGDRVAHFKVRGVLTWAVQKTAELIQMPFGILSQVSPENHVLRGGALPREGALLWEGLAHYKA